MEVFVSSKSIDPSLDEFGFGDAKFTGEQFLGLDGRNG
jgi:hypothetical protein